MIGKPKENHGKVEVFPLFKRLAMERSMNFNGKIHYFDWAIFNSKLLNYQRVSLMVHRDLIGGLVGILMVNIAERSLPLFIVNSQTISMNCANRTWNQFQVKS